MLGCATCVCSYGRSTPRPLTAHKIWEVVVLYLQDVEFVWRFARAAVFKYDTVDHTALQPETNQPGMLQGTRETSHGAPASHIRSPNPLARLAADMLLAALVRSGTSIRIVLRYEYSYGTVYDDGLR